MLRLARLSLGWVWAAALLWAGLWLRDHAELLPVRQTDTAARLITFAWVWSVAAGNFIFLALVADELCPRTPIYFSGFFKVFFGALAWMALLGGCLLWLR